MLPEVGLGPRLRQKNLDVLTYCLDKQVPNSVPRLPSVAEGQRKAFLGLSLSSKSPS